jgi:hypothetical protein
VEEELLGTLLEPVEEVEIVVGRVKEVSDIDELVGDALEEELVEGGCGQV